MLIAFRLERVVTPLLVLTPAIRNTTNSTVSSSRLSCTVTCWNAQIPDTTRRFNKMLQGGAPRSSTPAVEPKSEMLGSSHDFSGWTQYEQLDYGFDWVRICCNQPMACCEDCTRPERKQLDGVL